jgi:hypothetical protein
MTNSIWKREVKDTSGPIILFTPEAGVEPHAAAIFSIGHSLKSLGYQVLAVQCQGAYNRCPTMDMYAVPYATNYKPDPQICANCVGHSHKLLNYYKLTAIPLSEFATHELTKIADDAIATSPADLSTFTFEGISFGKSSLVDFSLISKVSNFDNLSPEKRLIWLHYIRASVVNYLIVNQVIDHYRPSAALYFADYSINLAARFASEKKGVPISSVTMPPHRIIDRTRFVICRKPTTVTSSELLQQCERWKNIPLAVSEVYEIAEDSLLRLGANGSHIYSPPKTTDSANLIKTLNLNQQKKTIVAFTSSMDEFNATLKSFEAYNFESTTTQTFASIDDSIQIGWLTRVIAFVEERHDIQLIVRVHPREGANKREGNTSDHLGLMRKHFDQEFNNIRFIWPENQTSSYDLAELADLVLTTWTTMGLECARLGIPVLSAHHGITISGTDFIEYGTTPEDYFVKVDRLLNKKPALETIRAAYRFHALYLLRWAVDMSDIINPANRNELPEPRVPVNARLIEEVVVKGKDLIELYFAEMSKNTSDSHREQESSALKTCLRQIIHYLLTGLTEVSDPKFIVLKADCSLTADVDLHTDDRVIFTKDNTLHYIFNNKAYSRYSPLVARLLPLVAQNSICLQLQKEVATSENLPIK